MHAAVQIAADGRQVGLALSFLRLSLGLALEETLLECAGLEILLFTGSAERLVESWHAFRLTSSIRFYSSPAIKKTLY